MLYPIHPGDVRQEYELRVAAALRKRGASPEPSMSLDFTDDFDEQRYAADGAARESRKAHLVPAPRRHLWDSIRSWVPGGWAWLGLPHRG